MEPEDPNENVDAMEDHLDAYEISRLHEMLEAGEGSDGNEGAAPCMGE